MPRGLRPDTDGDTPLFFCYTIGYRPDSGSKHRLPVVRSLDDRLFLLGTRADVRVNLSCKPSKTLDSGHCYMSLGEFV